MRLPIVAAAVLALVAACGTPATSSSSTPGPATSAASATAPADSTEPESAAASGPLGTEVSFAEMGATTSRAIAAATGGKVVLPLADGQKVSLRIAKGALPADTIITLTETSAAGQRAVRIEPAGTYLAKPALLSVPSTWTQQALIRIGSTPNGLLFAPAIRAPKGAVVITRLRPVLFTDDTVTPVPLTDSAATAVAAIGSDGIAQVDELDLLARTDEEKAADDPEHAESHPEDAAAAAAQAIPRVTEKCTQPNAGQRLVEARRTAGTQAAADLPECLTRAIHVFAHLDMQGPDAGGLLDMSEVVSGKGMIDTDAESTSFPLQGEWTGAAEAGSYVLTAFAYGMGTYAGLDVPPPSKDKCTMSPLQDGTMRATVVEAPDDMLRITLTPSGTYHEVCGDIELDQQMAVFSLLSQLKGGGEQDPLTVTLPRNGSSSNVFSLLSMAAQQGMKQSRNGDVVVSDSGFTASIGMTVTIAETMKDLDERNGASAAP